MERLKDDTNDENELLIDNRMKSKGICSRITTAWIIVGFLVIVCIGLGISLFVYHTNNKSTSNQNNTCDTTVLDSQIMNIVLQRGVSGCTMNSIKDGENVYSFAVGFQDFNTNVLLSPYSLMRIASISKPIAGMTLQVLLNNHDTYTWDSTIYDIIMDNDTLVEAFSQYTTLNRYMYNITLKQLVSHTAGFRHYQNLEEFLGDYPNIINSSNYVDNLELFGNDALLFEPGTSYYYSSYGFMILSILIEKISNNELYTTIYDSVLSPLNLKHTFDPNNINDEYIELVSKQYLRNCNQSNGVFQNVSYCYFDDTSVLFASNVYMKGAAGFIISNVIDISQFGYDIVFSDFFDDNIKDNYIFNGIYEINSNNYYSIGWHINRQTNPDYIWHTGGAIGGVTRLQINTLKKTSTAVFCNTQSSGNELNKNIADLIENYF